MNVVIRGGEIPAPIPTPANIIPLARPRSLDGIHDATRRLLAGYTTDSPIPSAKRTASRRPSAPAKPAGVSPVRAVNTAHQIVASVISRRGPKLSAIQPLTGWNKA